MRVPLEGKFQRRSGGQRCFWCRQVFASQSDRMNHSIAAHAPRKPEPLDLECLPERLANWFLLR